MGGDQRRSDEAGVGCVRAQIGLLDKKTHTDIDPSNQGAQTAPRGPLGVMLLFVHMHKCAGSTVRKSAQRSGLNLPSPHRNGNLLDASGAAVKYAPLDDDQAREILRTQRDAGVDFMAMEWDFPSIRAIPRRDVQIFTVLRDPLERAVSNFKYAKLRGSTKETTNFREFFGRSSGARQPLSRSNNYYVRKLSAGAPDKTLVVEDLRSAEAALRRFASVILLGKDDLQVSLMSLGITEFANTNITSQIKAVPGLSADAITVSDEDMAWFEKHNRFDRRLFTRLSEGRPLARRAERRAGKGAAAPEDESA